MTNDTVPIQIKRDKSTHVKITIPSGWFGQIMLYIKLYHSYLYIILTSDKNILYAKMVGGI